VVGIITAFLTSFYMFRLLFMTFFGERRLGAIDAGQEPHASHAPAQAGHGEAAASHIQAAAEPAVPPMRASATAANAHAHATHDDGVHESPWMMLGPLVILALLSVIGGWVGIPHSLGGHNHFEEFLRPVVHGATAEGTKASAAAAHADTSTELMLTGISVLVALLGAGLAWLMYVKRTDLPARARAALGGLYTAVYNKYFVDEMYDTAIVQPIKRGSESVLWQGIDVGTIDTAVNGTAVVWRGIGGALRRMQSGNIRSYAGWVAAGAALVVAYMLWVGVAK
jgi:NADH-quinone oxidoreductase subunit L